VKDNLKLWVDDSTEKYEIRRRDKRLRVYVEMFIDVHIFYALNQVLIATLHCMLKSELAARMLLQLSSQELTQSDSYHCAPMAQLVPPARLPYLLK
jgi:hypothetical protein